MSNYTQATDFSEKDSLPTGDPDKKIRGSDVDAEFSAIATAISSKEDTANKGIVDGYASLDGTGQVPIAQIPEDEISIDASQVTAGLLPLARGGTGAATRQAAREALGIYSGLIRYNEDSTYTCAVCPDGWTVTRLSAGVVRLDHTLGTALWTGSATGVDLAGADSVDVTMFAGAGADTSVNFYMRSEGDGLQDNSTYFTITLT